MASSKNPIGQLLLFGVIALVAVGFSLVTFMHRNHDTTVGFAAALSKGDYVTADAALSGLSSLTHLPDGSLGICDWQGNLVKVAASDLPFLATQASDVPAKRSGGGVLGGAALALEKSSESQFQMIAMGASIDGQLVRAPLLLYLSTEDGEISIDGFERVP